MKTILATQIVRALEGVTFKCKGRKITVVGPNGELTREFKHIKCSVDQLSATSIKIDVWGGLRKENAFLRTVCTHIKNMMVGVTKGYTYRLRCAYAHFPVTITLEGTKGVDQTVEIRNFIGQRRPRYVSIPKGVTVAKDSAVKDQYNVTGNAIEDVSQAAARLHQACLVRKKDIRKFLDGMYVSEKGATGEEKSIL